MTRLNVNRLNFSAWLPAAVTLFALLLAFYDGLYKLSLRWQGGDNSYAWLVPPLVVYLLWENRSKFDFRRLSPSRLLGLTLAVMAGLLGILGQLGSVETFVYLGIWLGCVAIAFALYGRRARELGFASLILLFIVPLPPLLNRLLTFRLKLWASVLAEHLLRLSGVSVLREGNILDLGISQLQVADACSGLRYFAPLILLSLLIGYFFNRGWWRRCLIFFVSVPLSILLNALRIYFSGILTVLGHPELAENFFHDLAGLVFFVLAGLILVGCARLLKQVDASGYQTAATENPVMTSVASSAAIWPLVGLMVLILGASGVAMHYRPAAGQLSEHKLLLADFPMQIGPWQGERHYLSDEVLNSLWADDYVQAVFTRPGTAVSINLLVPFYNQQTTRHTAHAPQSCLLGSGWVPLNEQRVTVRLAKQCALTVTELSDGQNHMLSAYFFYQRGRVITSPLANKFYLIWDSIRQGRTDGALVRVELLKAGEVTEADRAELVKFLETLWPRLGAYIPQ